MTEETVPPLTESECEALVLRHKRMNRKSLLIGGVGIFLQLLSGFFAPLDGGLVWIALPLLLWGFTIYAKMRGLSPWFGVLGVLGLIGLIVLLCIPPKCLVCGGRIVKKQCTRCQAPGPP